MAESSLAHNQQMQRIAIGAEVRDMREGRFAGIFVLLLLVAVAVYFGITGNIALASIFLGASVLGVVGEIIKGTRGGEKDD